MRSLRFHAALQGVLLVGVLFLGHGAWAQERTDDSSEREAPEKAAPSEERVEGGRKGGASNREDTSDPSTTSEPTSSPPSGRFEFGSYGRVLVTSDLRGRTGRPSDIVAYGSRTTLDSYTEFELRREDSFSADLRTRVVTTLALFPPFFHFSGKPEQHVGLRNLYAQGTYKDLNMWVGSRMYRGDDIYLLNWWPLDNQNTVGGGVSALLPTDTTVALHAGMQRLDNPFQVQERPVVAPYGFGAVNLRTLDRPRMVQTFKVTQFLRNREGHRRFFGSDGQGFKATAYGELHEIAAGVRRDLETQVESRLPSDIGVLFGAQLSYWTGERDTYASLFVRHARGLAAYDPLAVPLTFANDRTTSGSHETLVALAGNWEKDWFGIGAASYVRFFRDGGPVTTTMEKFDEGILLARPQVYLGDHWGVAVEGSYQVRRYGVIDPRTESPLTASIFRGALMPYFSPTGRGLFKRPQLGLLYSMAVRDSGARSVYPAEDVFSQRSIEHLAGIFAEWWFNSSSYP